MIRDSEILDLIALFRKRKVVLYHACQFKDLESYLKLGGVPSRAVLEKAQAQYTAFDTDKRDRVNRVWDKVFLNLSDFGRWFCEEAGNMPNPFGPILLIIKPNALASALDIAICLRSAGANSFKREKEALALEQVERLFCHPPNASAPQSTYVKFAEELQQEFCTPQARSPEISCTYPNGILPLEFVSKILVDPYTVGDQALVYLVQQTVDRSAPMLKGKIKRRPVNEARRKLYTELAAVMSSRAVSLKRIVATSSANSALKSWASGALENDLEYQFKRFSQYLFEGTLQPIREMQAATQNTGRTQKTRR